MAGRRRRSTVSTTSSPSQTGQRSLNAETRLARPWRVVVEHRKLAYPSLRAARDARDARTLQAGGAIDEGCHPGRRTRYPPRGRNDSPSEADDRDRGPADSVAHHEDLFELRA